MYGPWSDIDEHIADHSRMTADRSIASEHHKNDIVSFKTYHKIYTGSFNCLPQERYQVMLLIIQMNARWKWTICKFTARSIAHGKNDIDVIQNEKYSLHIAYQGKLRASKCSEWARRTISLTLFPLNISRLVKLKNLEFSINNFEDMILRWKSEKSTAKSLVRMFVFSVCPGSGPGIVNGYNRDK